MKAARQGLARRVPVYAQLHEFAAHQAGIPGSIFYRHPEIMAPALLQAQADFGLEVASLTYDVYNIEAEGLGQKLLYTAANMPDIDRSRPLIGGAGDLDLIQTPDFETAGRFRSVIAMLALFRDLTGLAPGLSFCAPFSLAANLCGIERLLVSMVEDPGFARCLLERLTERVLAPWIRYQQARFPGSTQITGADAFASLPIVNPRILGEWALPYIIRLQELCGPGVQVVNWIGERLLKQPEQMLALKSLAGPGAIQGQDPDVEALGPSFYVDYAARHNLYLSLGIGAGFLAHGSPVQIGERVRRYIEAGMRHGRFALYLCNVDAHTPPENLRAAIRSAENYGRYDGSPGLQRT